MGNVVDRSLQLKLIGDVQGLDKTQRKLGSFTKSVASWGKALAGGLFIGGLETMVSSAVDGVKAFREEESIVKAFRKTVRNMRLPLKATTAEMDRMAERAVTLGFDDAETIAGMRQFLSMTGDIEKASRMTSLAWDIARSKNISLAQAQKQVTAIYNGSAKALKQYGLEGVKGMEAVNAARRRERDQAREWLRNHPVEAAIGKISDSWADVTGSFAKGDFKGFVEGLQSLGSAVDEALFGRTGKKGNRFGGLVQKFGGWARKMAEEIAKVDWGAALGSALQKGLEALQTAGDNGTLSTLAVIGTAIAGGIFAVDLFVTAASKMFGLPRWALGAGAKVAGAAVGKAFRVSMFLLSAFVGAAEALFTGIASNMGLRRKAAGAGRQLGTSMGGGFNTTFLGKLGLLGFGLATAVAGITLLGEMVPEEQRVPTSLLASAVQARKRGAKDRGNVFAQLRRTFPQATDDEINAALSKAGFARGGIVSPAPGGRLVKVAEAGEREAIIPEHLWPAMGRGGGQTVINNFHISVPPTADQAAIGQTIIRALQAASRRDGGVGLRSALAAR